MSEACPTGHLETSTFDEYTFNTAMTDSQVKVSVSVIA